MKASPLLLAACAMMASVTTACAQSDPPPRAQQHFDPALVREQQRRIAAFDSVVRTVNTDSLYKLWHAMLTASDIRAAQLDMDCEMDRLDYQYGQAAYTAMEHMRDTLWRKDDPGAVSRMDQRMAGASTPIGRDTCGPPPPARAPYWLREWYVYALPRLPPAPDSAVKQPD
jgi:hypothetical protein